MKKKIIIGLAVYSFVLLLGGLYILRVIHSATATLDELIMLHQVEVLREHFLVQISRVQTDLVLKDTRHSREFDTVVSHVLNMDRVVNTCFSCHHTEPVQLRIRKLKHQTEVFKDTLSRVVTIRANSERLGQEGDAAFYAGEELLDQVRDMVASTAARLEATTQESLRKIDSTRYVLYVLVGIVPIVSAVLGFVFITGLTSPVNVLVDSTRKLKGGDLDHRVAGLRNEFGELANAFNEMAASLKEQMMKAQRAEQLALIGELSAGLAHEIKNPLAGIKVAMEVLGAEADLSEEDRRVVKKVNEEISHLQILMKSFLNFARPPKPQPVEVNVNNLLNTTLAFYGGRKQIPAEGRDGITTEKSFGDVPATMADPMQLQQVFLNLLINAVDAMPEGGKLAVGTRFDESSAEIEIDIADTGTGLAQEHTDKIFEPFFTTKRGGTGLGLAVSRQLIEQHGGSIGTAENPGGGTVFTVRLPLRPAEMTQGSAA